MVVMKNATSVGEAGWVIFDFVVDSSGFGWPLVSCDHFDGQ